MTLIDTIAVITLILIWTVAREVLLNKFWRHECGTHLAAWGNLYIVIGCMIASVAIIIATH